MKSSIAAAILSSRLMVRRCTARHPLLHGV